MSISTAYSSSVRERDAAETGKRIVTAAGRLFACDGYLATPQRAITAETGVSVQFEHLAGPKSSLLLAAWAHAFARGAGIWQAMRTAADADPQVRAAVSA